MEARSKPVAGVHMAYVLHAHDWSETSLILDVFSRTEGRLVCVAKGAKRPYSQLRSVLLPFQQVALQLNRVKASAAAASGDGAPPVRVLRTAEWAAGAGVMPSGQLLKGFYLNELLQKCLARDLPQPGLYDLYHLALQHLAHAGSEPQAQAVLRAFELCLLFEVGALPDLSTEALRGRVLQPDTRYTLQDGMGLVEATDSAPALTGAQWLAFQAALSHGHWPALMGLALPALGVLRALMRQWLTYHVGTADWRTREVVLALHRLGLHGPSRFAEQTAHEPLDA